MNRTLLLELGALDVTTLGILPGSEGGGDVSQLLQGLLLSQTVTIGRSLTQPLDGRTQSFGATVLYFPEGRYRFTRGVRIPGDAIVRFVGDGEGRTIFELYSDVPSGPARWPIGPAFEPNGVAIPPPYPPPHLDNLPLLVDEWRLGSPTNSVAIESLWEPYFRWVEERFLLHFCGMNRLSSYDADFAHRSWRESAFGRRGLLVGSDGQSPWAVEDITFEGGGILLYGTVGVSSPISSGKTAGGNQRAGVVTRCTFSDAPAWAIATDGERVVNVDVIDCTFLNCNAGIGVRYAQSDLWRVTDCTFSGTKTIDVQIASSNVTVEGCTFDEKPLASRVFPFIQLKNMPDFLALGPGSDSAEAGWDRTERPAAAYLINADGIVADVSYRTLGKDSVVPWSTSMLITGGIRLVDCAFGTRGGWATDAIVIGRWGTGDVPYPHGYGWPGTGDPENELPLTLDGLRLAPDKNSPDIVARGIVIEGCRFGPLDAASPRPRSALRLTVPVQDLCVLRASVGDVADVVYEEHSTRVWLDCLMAAAAQRLSIPEVAPPTFRSKLAQASQLTRGNVLEWIPARLISGRPFALTESFSLGGFGFDLGERGSQLRPQIFGDGWGGNSLLSNEIKPDKLYNTPDEVLNSIYLVSKESSSSAKSDGSPSFLDPRVNMLCSPVLGADVKSSQSSVTLSFRARRSPSTSEVTSTAWTLNLGVFVMAGSFQKVLPLGSEWMDVSECIRALPKVLDLAGRAPWTLVSLRNPDLLQASSLSKAVVWSDLRAAVLSKGLSLFSVDPKNDVLTLETPCLSATVYVRPHQGSSVELSGLTVSSGAVARIPQSLAGSDSTRQPNWKSTGLQWQVVLAGLNTPSSLAGTPPDLSEIDNPIGASVVVSLTADAAILRDGSEA